MGLSLFSLPTTCFPIWRYLNQPFWDSDHPFILNPHNYWLYYKTDHLKRCFHNSSLEECWQVSYPDFVIRHHAYCARTPLEEDPVWLIERCWQLERRKPYYFHPENHSLEGELL